MNCQQVQLEMADRSVGLLDADAARAYDAHVAACPACAAEGRRFERCMSLVSHAPRPAPSADLWMGIRARMDLERSISGYAPVHPLARPSRSVWSGAASAVLGFGAAMLVLVGVGSHTMTISPAVAAKPAAAATTMRVAMDNDSPVADVAATVAVDAATVRPMPALSVALARFAPDSTAQPSFIPAGGALR